MMRMFPSTDLRSTTQIRSVTLWITTLAILIVICSCSSEEADTLDRIPTPASRPLIADTFTPVYASPDCELEEGEPCVRLRFHYPVYNDHGAWTDSLTHWTQRQLIGHTTRQLDREIEGLAHEWFDDWEKFQSEIQNYRLPWRLERSVEVAYENEELVTLHFSDYQFSGGAHPNQHDTFQSFVKVDGRHITEEALTPDSTAYHRLLQLAEDHFRFTFELLEEESLEEAGFFFDDGNFHLAENIAFTEYGLLIYYNNYEVAPYVMGPISIELSYDELEHLLHSRWLPSEVNRPS